MTNLIVVKQLSKEFQKYKAIDNLNFTVEKGEILVFLGPSGSGKTTTAGKLANLFRKQGKKPLLVACDVYRPAAIKQLQVVGKQ